MVRIKCPSEDWDTHCTMQERDDPEQQCDESQTIRTLVDLADHLGAHYEDGDVTSVDRMGKRIARRVYKDTSAGCPATIGHDGRSWLFRVFPYCEGFDGDLSGMGEWVRLPCRPEQIDDAIEDADLYSDHIWAQTHGCEGCWDGAGVEGEFGGPVVDPNCKFCEGRGIVI